MRLFEKELEGVETRGTDLTRGHHSNNSSATLHDYSSGKIAWFAHRTKRGNGHNWEGTSGGG